MKRILLFSLSFALIPFAWSQQKTAFALTGVKKGLNNWSEVRVVNLETGEEVKTVYQRSQEAEILNARTGKLIARKTEAETAAVTPEPQQRVYSFTSQEGNTKVMVMRHATRVTTSNSLSSDHPFSTYSAACAYDQKHNRLYYTPMGINQLRYIDLKADNPKVYYFENEAFGVVKGRGDVASQITRMVIGADGHGYALSNDGNHLIQFTTKKKAVITDLGALADDASNGTNSVHSSSAYGGDMIAASDGNFYLITSSRSVFHINREKMVATYRGQITGLPRGYSTNGAIAEGGTSVLVSSSNSTSGYYRFDLKNLQATLATTSGSVYNASDLANAVLVTEEKKKKEDKPVETPLVVTPPAEDPATAMERKAPVPAEGAATISIFPNPITNGSSTRVSFNNQPAGVYQIQVLDASGKLVYNKRAVINSKTQFEDVQLPQMVTQGTYFVRVNAEGGKTAFTQKLIVQ